MAKNWADYLFEFFRFNRAKACNSDRVKESSDFGNRFNRNGIIQIISFAIFARKNVTPADIINNRNCRTNTLKSNLYKTKADNKKIQSDCYV